MHKLYNSATFAPGASLGLVQRSVPAMVPAVSAVGCSRPIADWLAIRGTMFGQPIQLS